MCSKQNRRFKSKHVQHDYKNKWNQKILTKHVSCEYKCKFDGIKWDSNQCWNSDKWRCEYKKHYICENGYTWNHAAYSCGNEKYLASIMDDSAM